MSSREEAYYAKIEELIHKAGNLEGEAVERVLKLLEDARLEVGARIAATEWQVYAVPQLKEAVGRTIDAFRQRYASELKGDLSNSWNVGVDLVDWPLHYVGIRTAAPELSMTALEILQGYSADLIKGLTEDALKQVNGRIAMGVLGQKTPYEVMREIGKSLDDPGVFKSISVRAETITRTEMATVQSAAREARIEATVEANPELDWMKKWISSGKFRPRLNHAALNGVTISVKKNFPGGIPYPHAPGLPASEVVNCGCTHVLTLKNWEKLPAGYTPERYTPKAIWD